MLTPLVLLRAMLGDLFVLLDKLTLMGLRGENLWPRQDAASPLGECPGPDASWLGRGKDPS